MSETRSQIFEPALRRPGEIGDSFAPSMSRRTVLAAAGAMAALGGVPNGAVAAENGRDVKVLPAQREWRSPPNLPPLSSGLVSLPDVRLWYSDTGGDGPPIVLLHPFTGSAHIWAYQQEAFVAAGYRVIAYSRRGHTGSDAGPADRTGTGADDLDRLLDALRIERFHLVGSAGGGFIAADYAVARPDRLASLTLASTQGGVIEPEYRERISAITPPAFFDLPESIRELGPSYRAGNPDGVRAWEALEHTSKPGGFIRQGAVNRLTWSEIEKIRTPTLIFTGAADLYMPVPLMLEYAKHLHRPARAIFSETGHSAYWEQPDAFNALVLGFIAQHHGRKRRARITE